MLSRDADRMLFGLYGVLAGCTTLFCVGLVLLGYAIGRR